MDRVRKGGAMVLRDGTNDQLAVRGRKPTLEAEVTFELRHAQAHRRYVNQRRERAVDVTAMRPRDFVPGVVVLRAQVFAPQAGQTAHGSPPRLRKAAGTPGGIPLRASGKRPFIIVTFLNCWFTNVTRSRWRAARRLAVPRRAGVYHAADAECGTPR